MADNQDTQSTVEAAMTLTPDHEAQAWTWLERMVESITDEAAQDISYSADQMVDAFMAGLQRRAAQPRDDVREALPRLDDGLIEAAMIGHYGKRSLESTIDGVSLTSNNVNWSFRSGFKRMWAGVRKELKRRNAALSTNSGPTEEQAVEYTGSPELGTPDPRAEHLKDTSARMTKGDHNTVPVTEAAEEQAASDAITCQRAIHTTKDR